jgi:uncharacterized protein YndB with AHSA1/START domain
MVLGIQPSRKLILSWADEDWITETQVTFLLDPGESNTLLTLLHTDWEHFPTKLGDTLLIHHQEGWKELLQNLKLLAENCVQSLKLNQN